MRHGAASDADAAEKGTGAAAPWLLSREEHAIASKGRFHSSMSKQRGAALVLLALLLCGVCAHLVRVYGYPVTRVDVGAAWSTTAEMCEAHGLTESTQNKQPTRPRVFDAFAFNVEADILELRLHELSPLVDRFVLVEASHTFSGKPKPFHFDRLKKEARFADFVPRIEHVKIDYEQMGLPDDPVLRKAMTKNAYMIGLERASARPDDFVVSTDLDEVPRLEVLRLITQCDGVRFPVTLRMHSYLYDFGCRDSVKWAVGGVLRTDNVWDRAKVVRFGHLRPASECTSPSLRPDEFHLLPASRVCPNELRGRQYANLGASLNPGVAEHPLTISNGGWHMSYFMPIDMVIRKIGSISHVERDTPENRDPGKIRCLVRHCRHVNGQDRGDRMVDGAFADAPRFARQQYDNGEGYFSAYFPRMVDLKCDEEQYRAMWA